MDDRRGSGFGQRHTGGGSPKGDNADSRPDRLPVPHGTAQLYERLRSRYEMTYPSIFSSLRLLMPFQDHLRSRYCFTTA